MDPSDIDATRVFVVRLSGDDAGALRGHVRDGSTGAYRAFTNWHELTAFLADQLEIDRKVPTQPARRSARKEKP